MRNALLAAFVVTSMAWPPGLAWAAPPPITPTAEAAQADDDRIAWLLVLAGAASLAVSATFALRAASDHEDWTAARDPDRKALLKERGTERALAADVTGAAGLLVAGTGALLIFAF